MQVFGQFTDRMNFPIKFCSLHTDLCVANHHSLEFAAKSYAMGRIGLFIIYFPAVTMDYCDNIERKLSYLLTFERLSKTYAKSEIYEVKKIACSNFCLWYIAIDYDFIICILQAGILVFNIIFLQEIKER